MSHSFALGLTNNGTTLQGGTLRLVGDRLRSASLRQVHVPGEILTISAPATLASQGDTNSWAGNIVMNADLTVTAGSDPFTLAGRISGSGKLVIGGFDVVLAGSTPNTYTNDTVVDFGQLVLRKMGIAIPGDLVMERQARVYFEGPNQITNPARVNTGDEYSRLYMRGYDLAIGSLAGDGDVDIENNSLFVGYNNISTIFNGWIHGAGDMDKVGTGTLTLRGESHELDGGIRISGGRLNVDGNFLRVPVLVSAAGTLGGGGSVGAVINLGGVISPGASPGLFSSWSNVIFNSSSEFNVDLHGPERGTGWDQFLVEGNANLGGAALNVFVGPGFAPAEGDRFNILATDLSAGSLTGTFGGLTNNAAFSSGSLEFRLLYSQGTGGSVVLMVTNTALKVAGDPLIQTGNGNNTIDPGECNFLRIILTNRFGSAVSGIRATLSPVSRDVTVTQPFSTYPNIPGFGRRTNNTTFQISTSPTLLCGTNIDLILTINTSTHGNFKLPIRMYSGAPATPVGYNNDTDLAIPDIGTVDSIINVSGISTPLAQLMVSLHLTHTAVGDLSLSLISPDGTNIVLSTGNGGTGNDYGAGDAQIDRTTFLDAAPLSITAGVPPFAAGYHPEEPLSTFRGKRASVVNGAWRLRITDAAGGSLGTLRAWSLFVSPAACPPGGGECESCVPLIAGQLTTNSPGQITWLRETAVPSSCATNVGCTSYTTFVQFPREYAVHKFTNHGPETCVAVAWTLPCVGADSAAYLNNYDPTDPCANFLGDAGATVPDEGGAYSFRVPAGAVFVVVLRAWAQPRCDYTLKVSGLDCPHRLDIARVPAANRVVLKWSTAALGYNLVSTNSLKNPPNAFTSNGPPPVVVSGKFIVTNPVSGSARFYELRK